MEELMLGEKMGKIEEEETQAELGTVTDVKPKGSVFLLSIELLLTTTSIEIFYFKELISLKMNHSY